MSRTKVSGIYSITNIINSKRYIGQTSYFNGRKGDHKLNLRRNQHDNQRLQHSWNKYGEINFKFELLEEIPRLSDGTVNKELLTKREQYWMDYYDSSNPEKGYNINPLAETNPMQGKHHSEESKLKISKRAENRKTRIPFLSKYIQNSEVIEQKRKDKQYVSLFEYKINTLNGDVYVFDDLDLQDFCNQLSLSKPSIIRNLIFGYHYKGISGTIIPLNEKGEKRLQFIINKNLNTKTFYTYFLTDPKGKEHICVNLNNFCRENKLAISCMHSLINKGTFYKGWSGYKISSRE
jgi:group I intron endonuclease